MEIWTEGPHRGPLDSDCTQKFQQLETREPLPSCKHDVAHDRGTASKEDTGRHFSAVPAPVILQQPWNLSTHGCPPVCSTHGHELGHNLVFGRKPFVHHFVKTGPSAHA